MKTPNSPRIGLTTLGITMACFLFAGATHLLEAANESLIPSNDLNFRIGITMSQGEKFPGEMGRVSILKRA